MTDPREELSRVVRNAPEMPELSDTEVVHLVAAITAATDRQQEALTRAMESGLEFVPRLLRGPVRKALFR